MKTRYVIAPIVILAMLAAFSAPAMAQCPQEIETWRNATWNGTLNNGYVMVEYHPPGGGSSHADWSFTIPSGEIIFVGLIWHGYGPAYTITFNGHSLTLDECQQNATCGNCRDGDRATEGNYWDVTQYAHTGVNNVTNIDPASMWQYAIVVVNNTDAAHQTHNGNWWVNKGFRFVEQGGSEDHYTTYFYGDINGSINHTLWTAQSHEEHVYLNFNGDWIDDWVQDDPWYGVHLHKSTVNTTVIDPTISPQSMEWINDRSQGGYSGFNIYFAVLAEQHPNPPEDRPDLVVEKIIIEHLNDSCYCQTPTGIVECHEYDVDALIHNDGNEPTPATGFNVSLFDGVNRVGTVRVNKILNPCDREWVRFQWHPQTSGTHTLRIMADSDYEVLEGNETNNNLTQVEDVFAAGQADLFAYPCCINFTPAWQSNRTNIIVTVLNNGTGDANNFQVTVTVRNATTNELLNETSQTTSVCAKAKRELTFAPDYELTKGNVTSVTVKLDSTNAVGESNEGNNVETKIYEAIAVTLKVSHHYGNSSDYNGVLTNGNTMEMLDISKVVTNYTTAWQLLTSEVDVCQQEENCMCPDAKHERYTYGLNRSDEQGTSTWYMNESFIEAETCPRWHYIAWYPYMNGIPMSTDVLPYEWGDYHFKDCEVMHMDINKWINPGNGTRQFKARPVTDYPEPFLHGYNCTAWNTTIVYPSCDSSYYTYAERIKAKLNSYGVPNERINIRTNATLDANEKRDNHLILLGTPLENHLIAQISANYSNSTEVGAPVYFNLTDPDNCTIVDDSLYDTADPDIENCPNSTFDHGAVVMACDNPFNNPAPWSDTWRDTNQTVFIASGLNKWDARDAAKMLITQTDELNRFWRIKQAMCGDVDASGAVKKSDARKLKMYYLTGYLITSEWAGDVDCSGAIKKSDARKLKMYYLTGYVLDCCTGCS